MHSATVLLLYCIILLDGKLDVYALALGNVEHQNAAAYLYLCALYSAANGYFRSGGFLGGSLFGLCAALVDALYLFGGEGSEGVIGAGELCVEHLTDGQRAGNIQQAGLDKVVKDGGVFKVVLGDGDACFGTAAQNRGLFLIGKGVFQGNRHMSSPFVLY